MSGRLRGCNSERGGRAARGSNYSGAGTTSSKQKGLCAALGDNVFNYGAKGSADQMRNSWARIVHHIGTIMGQEISNELQNKTEFIIKKPEYTQVIKDKNVIDEARQLLQYNRIHAAQTTKLTALTTLATGGDATAGLELAILQNEMEEEAYKILHSITHHPTRR